MVFLKSQVKCEFSQKYCVQNGCRALCAKAYYKISEVHIELYTDCKDLSVERHLEAVLDRHGIFYEKTETWIESERLYEVLYYFEMEV